MKEWELFGDSENGFHILNEYFDSNGDYVCQVEVDPELNEVLSEKYGTSNYGDFLSKEFNDYIRELSKNT